MEILSKVLVCTSGKVLFPLTDINIRKMEILQCTLLVFVKELNWLKLATLMANGLKKFEIEFVS